MVMILFIHIMVDDFLSLNFHSLKSHFHLDPEEKILSHVILESYFTNSIRLGLLEIL